MDVKGIVNGVNPYLNPKVAGAEVREAQEQATRTAAQQTVAAGDVVNISDTAKLQAFAAREATQAPDVRRERIEELKEKVASGQYKPDSRKIAAGIIKNDLDLLVKG
jgi:negative regulator of flagellin synthesis FlgM